MTSGSSDNYRNVTRYQGQDYSFAPRYIRGRDPHSPTNASGDIKPKEQQGYYPTGSFWTNSTNGKLWALQKITSNLANWVLLSSASGPLLNISVPNGTTPIVPDTAGFVNFTSTLGTVVITGSSASPNNHTINFDLEGGGEAIDSIMVDANTLPGTNPVVPTIAGLVTITGGQVATGVIGANVIRTDSLAANTFTIEIQRTTAVVAGDSTKNGVSHFDSANFAVSAAGFVTMANGTALTKIGVDVNTAPGTNPVLPTAAGQITVTGGQVAASAVGTNVIRTDSLAANTYTVEIQRSQAVASSTIADNGVSHFDSARFTVDANGFVSTNGTGIVKWNIISANQTLAINNGYICVSPGGALLLALPAASTLGDIIEVTLDGATSWSITQAAGQQIRYNNLQTTLGATGSLTSTDTGNTIRMVCQTANTKWNVLSALGTLTVA